MIVRAEKVITVDSQIVTYFLNATDDTLPMSRRLTAEYEAVFHIALTYGFRLLPTVERQIKAIPDLTRLLKHQQSLMTLFSPTNLNYPEFVSKINERERTLLEHHSDKTDCRILAEAEAVESEILLTLDKNFQKRLQPHTDIDLLKPTQFKIVPGTPLKFRPVAETTQSLGKIARRVLEKALR